MDDTKADILIAIKQSLDHAVAARIKQQRNIIKAQQQGTYTLNMTRKLNELRAYENGIREAYAVAEMA